MILIPGSSKTSEVVAEEFSTALLETGRFRLASKGEAVSAFDADSIRSASGRGIDYLLKIEAESLDRAISFKMSLISTPRGSEIGRLEARVEPSNKSDLILENLQNYLLLHPK